MNVEMAYMLPRAAAEDVEADGASRASVPSGPEDQARRRSSASMTSRCPVAHVMVVFQYEAGVFASQRAPCSLASNQKGDWRLSRGAE